MGQWFWREGLRISSGAPRALTIFLPWFSGGALMGPVEGLAAGESGAGAPGPQSPLLWHQAPWEEPLEGPPRVRVSPKEAGRPEVMVVRSAEVRADVRALGRGSVGPRVLMQGVFKGLMWLGGPCPFSRPV